jgi:adenine-specific DNA methylase
MAPGIALEVLARAKKPLRVLDPMMGSGTVLAVARSRGHLATGVDIDPLAVLISKAWTTAIDSDGVLGRAAQVLERARGEFSGMPVGDAYPRGADAETRRFIRYWFDGHARRQLASLAKTISRVRDDRTRVALWCAFSRLIICKQSGASRAMDLSHSRPHRVFDTAPTKPFSKFISAVDHVVENAIHSLRADRGPAPRIHHGDARALPLPNASIDLVLTSPPYLNAIDYMRCSKFSLVWMGHSIANLRRTRAESVGTEVGAKEPSQDEGHIRTIVMRLRLKERLSPRDVAILWRYIGDMCEALREVARVLAPNGRAVYVIGENTVRGTFIRNSVIVKAVAELSGLKLSSNRVRTLPADRRYLPPPSTQEDAEALSARMRREVVLSFEKAS